MDSVVESHIRYEDRDLDNVLHIAARLLDNGLDVFEHRLRLQLYIPLTDYVAGGVQGDLTRDVDRASSRGLDPRGESTPTHGCRQAGIIDHTP